MDKQNVISLYSGILRSQKSNKAGMNLENMRSEKSQTWGQSRGIVARFVRPASVAQGLQVQILGTDLVLLIKPRCGSIPHKTEEDWQQMLAQRQSSKRKEKSR